MSTYEDIVYTGQIPSTKIEELFDTDKLTDERIENELKDNTVTILQIIKNQTPKNNKITDHLI